VLSTEPIGSVPRSAELLGALAAHEAGELDDAGLAAVQDDAIRETIARFDSTHSADVDYAELLPELFRMRAGAFYLQMASETDRPRVLEIVRDTIRPDQTVFVGVIDPIDPEIESADTVRERVLEAASFIPVTQLGTTDDCGFSPFADDTSTSRDIAFAKVAARVAGTAAASEALGV
jgi:5-methyltetrahydropteroyltriglutamate--homocysteine methyltransferase